MPIEVGQEAPDFTLRDRDNQEVALSSFRGRRNVVLIFYPLAFSGNCTRQLTEVGGHGDRYAALDAQVLAVSVDSRYVQGAFQDAIGASHVTFLADFQPKGAVARAYGVYLDGHGYANRATLVIDRDGIVREALVMPNPGELPDEAACLTALAACAGAA